MPASESEAERIFLAALEQHSPDRWESFIQQQCGPDQALRERVNILLRAHAKSTRIPELVPPVATLDLTFSPERPGMQIGPYKLLEQIGEGGMGLVYVAEQKEPVRRTVALKVIKPGMDSQQVVARFEAERQALAMMNHSNIAKVLDAGATESGRPYFVMELVKGVPITEFCDQQQFDTRERVKLFITVCQAVQHAHQKGLIHRDLKPSNLLVEMHDVVPVPKVIDFGVAKAIGQQLTERTLHTGFSQMVGTPLYMSPEQAGQSSIDVDTRSDVYSLGVLLYEILTGYTPFESDTLRDAGYDEMRRIIREVDPPLPSARVSTLEAKAQSTVSVRRKTEAHQLTKSLRGELDWIVMKALEKDRNRRYDSPASFAADVQRYLNDEPVQACPPSAGYRFRKFAHRNKRSVATCGLVGTAIVMGVVISTWQAIEANYARRQTDTSLIRESVARNQAEDSFRIARQAIEATTQRIANDPRLKSRNFVGLRKELLATAVPFYEQLGKQKLDDRRLQIEMAITLRNLAQLHRYLGESDAVRAGYERMIVILDEQARLSPNDQEVQFYLAQGHRELGTTIADLGDMVVAESHLRTAQNVIDAAADRSPTPSNRQTQASVHLNLGQFLRKCSREQEAERELTRAIEIWNELSSKSANDSEEDDTLMAVALNTLGILHAGQKRNAEAEIDLAAACTEYRRIVALANGNPNAQAGLSSCLDNLASILEILGKHEEQLAAERESLGIIESLVTEYPNVPSYQINLGAHYCNSGIRVADGGAPAESLPYLEKAIAVLNSVLAQDSRDVTARQFVANSYASLGKALSALHKTEDAMIAFDQGIAWAHDHQKGGLVFTKAMALSRTEPERAIEIVEPLLREVTDRSAVPYNVACLFSQMSARASDERERDLYAERALQLLERAQAEGYFTPSTIANFQKDSDFSPLRNRDDFRAFAQGLQGPNKSSSPAP